MCNVRLGLRLEGTLADFPAWPEESLAGPIELGAIFEEELEVFPQRAGIAVTRVRHGEASARPLEPYEYRRR